MTKQEKIKEAYGIHFEEVKYSVDENGWVSFGNSNAFRLDGKMEQEVDSYNGKFRPKSLQGIENNNGWVKIESENDLPQKTIYKENINWYYGGRFLDNGDFIYLDYRLDFTKLWEHYKFETITHYQSVVNPFNAIF